MTKKAKLRKTLVDQVLDKTKTERDSLAINAFEGDLPDDIEKSDIFETLALVGDRTGPLIGIVQITEHLSKKKLAKVPGNKKVSMIPQKNLQKTTGYIRGVNNPVGIHQKRNFPIFINNRALEMGTMIVSAGEIGHSIRIGSQTLADFVGASFADLTDDSH